MVKMENIEKINELVKIHKDCVYAVAGCDEFSVGNYKDGYRCRLATHRDPSGPTIIMDGLNVGRQVAEAVKGVLESKLKEIEEELNSLGVEV